MMSHNFCLIIGAMKCGTTSLFYYLAEHPQIAPAKEKEPHFFAYDSYYSRGIDEYHRLWNWQPGQTIAMEASTTYTMHPKYLQVPERIAQVQNANVRFIYMIRHPIARVKSHMRHLLSGGHQQKVEVIEEHLAFTEYARQLDRFSSIFGRDRIHCLLLEDLQADPKTELYKICQFLGIDPDFQFQRTDTVMNSEKTLNLHPKLRQLYQNPAVKSMVRLISPELRQKLYAPLSRKDTFTIQLSEQEQAAILERLRPDLQRLQSEYGVHFQHRWNLPGEWAVQKPLHIS
jgi:hypothetical protein